MGSSDFRLVKPLAKCILVAISGGLMPQGVYDNLTAYVKGDAVSYNGKSYIALTNTTGNLPTDTDFWMLLADQGPQGNQGVQGFIGNQGVQGIQGFQGNLGITGAQGTQGVQGQIGVQGNQGIQGLIGLQGVQGHVGLSGVQGDMGYQGDRGIDGNQGNQGEKGTTGDQGNQGTQGNQGIIGSQGLTGNQGFQGIQGNVGSQGSTGSQGTQGIMGLQGNQGSLGNQGNQGIQGVQGFNGTEGTQGNQGYQGNQGFQSSVEGPQGTQGFQGNQGSVGSQGNQGNQGNQGDTGNNMLPTIATDTYFVTGFVSRTDNTISFNDGTTTFTIAPTGVNYSFYSASVKYTKAAPITLDLSTVTGWGTNKMVFIYFDTSGNIQGSITPWAIISANSPIATVFWNGTNGALADERHTAGRNLAWHDWSHKTVGARYISGLQGTFTTSATTIALGSFADDDITFNYGQQTSVVIWKTAPGGATFTFDSTPVATSASIVAGALKWDNAGTVTNVTSGYFIRNFIYVSNVTANPIACVVAQSEHSNLADCRNSALPTFPTYISNENKLIYSVCWQNVGGTPTFVESTDYRTSPSTANGGLAVKPTFLNDLEDTIVSSPNTDDTLRFNGTDWVNGSPASSSASAGIEFFPDDTNIVASGVQNAYPIKTLGKTPGAGAEDVDSISMTNNTVLYGTYLYDTALGRTTIDAGVWQFDLYVGVSSATNVTTLRQNINRVRPGTGTVTTTGTGTTRTATASTGTPFAVAAIDVGGTIDSDSFLRTTTGYFRILSRVSDVEITIETLSTYTNQTTVAYSVHKRLFQITTPELNNVATAPLYAGLILESVTSVQPAFAVQATDKLASAFFGVSTGTRVVYFAHNGTTRYSHFQTPLITLHGNLAGLQGGTGSVPTEEYYHLTSAQYTVVGNTTGTNSGDVTLAVDSGLAITGQVLNMGTPSTVTNATTNSVTTNTHTHAVTGFTGPQGNQGSPGPQGSTGSQGNQGNVGSQGNQGSIGNQGSQGSVGAQGNQGNVGSQGNQGNIGSQGNQGSVGSQGSQGSQGNQGSPYVVWSEVTGTTQAMAVNNGYILNNGSLVTATLPSTAAVGSVIKVVGKGAGGWRIAQNASQFINFIGLVTTIGTGGRLDSTVQYDCVELLCTTANNGWIVLSSVGNITVT